MSATDVDLELEESEEEPENPDAEPEGEEGPADLSDLEPAPPFDPDPDGPMSEKQLDAVHDKIERETARHDKRLVEIMGEDFELTSPCPCCQIPGRVFPFQEFDAMDLERKNRVLSYFHENPDELLADQTTIRCERCAGWGYLRTGSRNGENARKLCDDCTGKGYITKPIPIPQPDYTYTPQGVYPSPLNGSGGGQPSWTAPVEPAPPSGWTPEPHKGGNDGWGRWPGHARYGIDPNAPGGQW